MKTVRKLIGTISYKHVLAVILLAAIFYTASATLPLTLEQIGSYFRKSGKAAKPAITTQIGDSYLNMLDFDGNMLLNKGSYLNLNGLLARFMGQRFMNERVKLDNGHLALLNARCDVTLPAKKVTQLCESQRERGGQFLFVIAPSQFPKYENILPAGFDDYTNLNADDLAGMLRANGVPVLDLRDALHEEGISHTDAFFVTDHHWTPETGFWAYTKVIEYFAGLGVIDVLESKYTDISEFNIEIFKNWFLGSSGRRTGIYYAGVDDFEIITPKFATDGMSVEIPGKNISKQGNFADVAYNMSENRLDYFRCSPYSAYGNSDSGSKSYRNNSAPVDLKVLSIGDSLTNVPFTFLPLVFTTCDELDMRYYTGDFQEYYRDYNPDIIIIMVGAASPVQPNTTYNFTG